jgi:hypothetical protein
MEKTLNRNNERDKQKFWRYIASHTISDYQSVMGLYVFCKTIGLSKEKVVQNFGTIEGLSSLFYAKQVYEIEN